MLNKQITKGLGTGIQSIVTQSFGGLIYYLKGWVTSFKKEILELSAKVEPVIAVEKQEVRFQFEIEGRELEFELNTRYYDIEKEIYNISIDRIENMSLIYHLEINNSVEKQIVISTIDKTEIINYIEHLGTIREIECSDRSQVFDEAHQYFETPQL